MEDHWGRAGTRVYPCVGSLAHQAESPDPGPVCLRREGRVERCRRQNAKRYAAAGRIFCGNSGGLCGKNIMLTRAPASERLSDTPVQISHPLPTPAARLPPPQRGRGTDSSPWVKEGARSGWSAKLVTKLAPCPAPRLEAVRSVCYSFPPSVVRSCNSARGVRVLSHRPPPTPS